MQYGLILPHFGPHADPGLLREGALLAESLGFSSLWARDHLLYRPHEFEDQSPTFYEAFMTLTWIAGQVERITFGTATAIPTRHPLHLAQLITTLVALLGRDRVLVGLGSGASTHEFHPVGLGEMRRGALVVEQAEVLRRAWTGSLPGFESDHYRFDPRIRGGSLVGPGAPLLFAGAGPLSVRRAARAFDGWLPTRVPLTTLRVRLDELRSLFAERKAAPIVGTVPICSVAATHEAAFETVDVEGLLAFANAQETWARPESGIFSGPEDLAGGLVAGTPDDVAEQFRQLDDLGVDHVILDLRMRFADWLDQIRLLGSEVLPAMRR